MDMAGMITWAVVGWLVFYLVNIYNHLVRIKHDVAKAWSNIIADADVGELFNSA